MSALGILYWHKHCLEARLPVVIYVAGALKSSNLGLVGTAMNASYNQPDRNKANLSVKVGEECSALVEGKVNCYYRTLIILVLVCQVPLPEEDLPHLTWYHLVPQ